MRMQSLIAFFCCALLAAAASHPASGQPETSEVRLHFSAPSAHAAHVVPAVVWLEPFAGTEVPAFAPRGRYTLLQKNRAFHPHLLVIPVGSVVQFPNADPFFHNVFSLFDGKRFDLGLYEAGSTRSVTFSREGVSYIFCNIHPEMSAVVLTLSTPLFAVGNTRTAFILHEVPPGDYRLHVWIEGATQADLNKLTRVVHAGPRPVDIGEIALPASHIRAAQHTDEYGHPYRPATRTIY